jgi:hypothetical protein
MLKMGGLKMIKIMPKMTPYKIIEKWPKFAKKLICSGGVKIVKNRPRGPRTQKHKFFEILQFSTKAPPFFDPINWPYKNVIPHK